MVMVVGESLRWLELNLTTLPGSILRWSSRWAPHGSGMLSRALSNVPATLMRGWSWWADPGFSVVDSVFWSLVTAVESVALVSMLGFFFVFYGCTF